LLVHGFFHVEEVTMSPPYPIGKCSCNRRPMRWLRHHQVPPGHSATTPGLGDRLMNFARAKIATPAAQG
jgi:hypothetical protein